MTVQRGRHFLQIPGPTNVPDRVLRAMDAPTIDHRGPEFARLLERCAGGLQAAFRTTSEIVILTASGTGGLEAAVVNHLSPGDPVLAVTIGAFGDRFAKIATTYGADVTRLAMEWGRAAEAGDVAAAAREMAARGRAPAAVLLTHNETSTGVTNPVAELAAAARTVVPGVLVIVDAISSLGAVPFETDAWDLDVVVTGSQKSWMVPPGLAMVSVSERAWAAAERATMPRFYFDLAAHRQSAATGETPWTPAVSVCFALDVAIALLEAEGYEAIFARHRACGAAARAGLRALGLALFADPAHASDTVTAAYVPDGLEWSALNGALKARGLILAGGQGKLAGHILRLGHLGAVTVNDVLAALAIIEDALIALGLPPGERGAALVEAVRAADASVQVPAGSAV